MHPRISLLVLVSSVAALSAMEERFRFERPVMGTRFVVTCYAADRGVAETAATAAFGIAEEVNAVASDHLPESELSLLASKPVGRPISLSPLLFSLLEHSRRIAEATGGAFDPTLGPLTKLWRQTRDHGQLPDAETLRDARARVGWQNFTLDTGSRTITLLQDHMAFDLGAVAKGYAADLMLESMAENGIRRAIIVAGGEIRLGEPPPSRDGWRVALQTFDRSRPDEVVTLSNAAVSTSGDLYQSVEIEGVRYSHIVSPYTGLGLTRRIAAIVIADEAKFSDPLSTAACVMGPETSGVLKNYPGLRELKLRTPQESEMLIEENHLSNP